jgi:hypothetical protein
LLDGAFIEEAGCGGLIFHIAHHLTSFLSKSGATRAVHRGKREASRVAWMDKKG